MKRKGQTRKSNIKKGFGWFRKGVSVVVLVLKGGELNFSVSVSKLIGNGFACQGGCSIGGLAGDKEEPGFSSLVC